MLVLGIDPGFLNTGYCLVDVEEGRASIRRDRMGCPLMGNLRIVSDMETGTNRTEDNIRRTREIFFKLDVLCVEHRVDMIAAEAMSFPRSSSAAHKMGLCWGVITCLSSAKGIYLWQAFPMQIKEAVTGRRSASKIEVQEVLMEEYNVHGDLIPRSYREHAFDALGAVHAFRQSDQLFMQLCRAEGVAQAREV